MTSRKDEVEADKGELEEEAKRLAGQLNVEKLEKRSESLKRGLPRPDGGEGVVLGETKVVGDDDMAGVSEDVQSLVRKELAYIISSKMQCTLLRPRAVRQHCASANAPCPGGGRPGFGKGQ